MAIRSLRRWIRPPSSDFPRKPPVTKCSASIRRQHLGQSPGEGMYAWIRAGKVSCVSYAALLSGGAPRFRARAEPVGLPLWEKPTMRSVALDLVLGHVGIREARRL
ncbi:hypothetical protein K456DRAFT_1100148 [Colletotrichum gloeosporioides 23]|nr:hypothetical protein K456DRAFT_1100148 [Colletotrichum gloeosporioides 23]